MFCYRLALKLGIPEPDQWMRTLDANQFNGWLLFAEQEPFGSDVEWLQIGYLASAIVNNIPFRGKDAKALQPSSFIPSKLAAKKKKTSKLDPSVTQPLSAIAGKATKGIKHAKTTRTRKPK